MASPAVTYTFTNSTTADATQVNQNFSDLIAGMTDGSKSFSIDALTVSGACLLNGTVGLGNASSDDITFTGYVASAITPKTDATYGLGTAALAWGSLYVQGATSLDGAVTINDAGENLDFRVEGDTEANLLFVDASADKVGIGTNAPGTALHVVGAIKATTTVNTDSIIEVTSTKGVKIQGATDGVATTNAAYDGKIGELLTTTSTPRSAATTLTSLTAVNLSGTLTLGAGTYMINASGSVVATVATTYKYLAVAISGSTGAMPTADTESVPTSGESQIINSNAGTIIAANYSLGLNPPTVIVTLAGATNFFCVLTCEFSGGTVKGFGYINAVRIA